MRLLATARGAVNATMAEVVADHILLHTLKADPKASRADRQPLDDLLDVLRTYIR
jgi:DNA-binding FrmR family transcriptional regulator